MKLLAVFLFVYAVQAGPVERSECPLQDFIDKFHEDPLHVPDQNLELDNEYASGTLSTKNVVVSGHSDVEHDIKVRIHNLTAYRANIEGSIPRVQFSGEYNANLLLKALNNSKFDGNGKFNGWLQNGQLKASAVLRLKPNGRVEAHNIVWDVDFEDADFQADNAHLDGNLIDWDSINFHEMFQELWPTIKPTIDEIVQKVVNDILSKCTIKEILDIISNLKP